MANIVGVRFKSVGKIYYFDPLDIDVKEGDSVIVETSRGIEMGKVVLDKREVSDDDVTKPLKTVMRIADEKDFQKNLKNFEKRS